ncbi:MAG: hypothetical protein HYR70_00610 [Chloroflexi bacterium]|nr:hypothetical protein [Chloroflexota bacterium]MBI3341378.1 hypothetical protein [Chloroflexota bacterium]
MNLDLELTTGVFSSAPASGVLKSPAINGKIAPPIFLPILPSFQNVMKEFGSFPDEALFLDIADDGLLNIADSMPGSILVTGDSDACRTDFLKSIARSIVSTHQPRKIQFGAITRYIHEWNTYAGYPHCIGVFPMTHKNAFDFIQALAVWVEKNKTSQQSVFLLIDNLADFIYCNSGLVRELQEILLYGPAKKIWPVVTINPGNFQKDNPWLKCFHTRALGHNFNTAAIDYHLVGFESLIGNVEFILQDGFRQIKFRTPKIVD